MEKKFTDGPWRRDDRDGVMGIAAGADFENRPEEWVVGGCGCCGSPGGVDCEDVAVANANLIVSAPEMFEALEGMIKEFGIRGGDGDDLLPVCKQPVTVASAMRIIAKALGKS